MKCNKSPYAAAYIINSQRDLFHYRDVLKGYHDKKSARPIGRTLLFMSASTYFPGPLPAKYLRHE